MERVSRTRRASRRLDAPGKAPDGVPFAWLYTPWPETPVCRTTDFGVIHQGRERRNPSIVLREIPDANVRMYPVPWEEERFAKYLDVTATIPGLIPLGRLGLYKYVTTDSTFAMVERLFDALPQYQASGTEERLALLKMIRGDWSNLRWLHISKWRLCGERRGSVIEQLRRELQTSVVQVKPRDVGTAPPASDCCRRRRTPRRPSCASPPER